MHHIKIQRAFRPMGCPRGGDQGHLTGKKIPLTNEELGAQRRAGRGPKSEPMEATANDLAIKPHLASTGRGKFEISPYIARLAGPSSNMSRVGNINLVSEEKPTFSIK